MWCLGATTNPEGITKLSVCRMHMRTLTPHMLASHIKSNSTCCDRERWMERAAATIHLGPETAYFLSSHISALRDTGISAVTAWQFSAAHSDSDLSALHTVTFSNGTWGEWTGPSRANVVMNHCPPLGLAVMLACLFVSITCLPKRSHRSVTARLTRWISKTRKRKVKTASVVFV